MTETKKYIEDVRILYIHKFMYKDKNKAKWMHHKPAEGHLYRALFAPMNGIDFYRLLMEDDTMEVGNMLLMDLQGDNKDWQWDITEVTEDNITDLPLDAEQFAQLAMWRDTKHEDITQFRRENIESITHDGEEIIEKIDPIEEECTKEEERESLTYEELDNNELLVYEEEIEFTDGIFKTLKSLKTIEEIDSEMFNVLRTLIDYLSSTYSDKYEDNGNNMSKIILKDPVFGKGASLFNTIKYIQRYLTTGYIKSENPQDLQKAIHYILFELIRKNT